MCVLQKTRTSAVATRTKIKADYTKALSVRIACPESIGVFVDLNDDGSVALNPADVATGTFSFTANDSQLTQSQALAIPQVKWIDCIEGRVPGERIQMSGTCCKEVQIGEDTYNEAIEVAFVECKKQPIKGAYLKKDECWSVAWKDCECQSGYVGVARVSFPTNQRKDSTNRTHIERVVRFDWIEGPYQVDPNVADCWPQRPDCEAAPSTKEVVDPCTCLVYTQTPISLNRVEPVAIETEE